MTSILLVDDHDLLREGLGMLIDSKRELEVVGQTNDGLDAITLAEELHPDVTVMDVWLPHLSGIDATREIVKKNPAARIVVLSVSEKQSVVECSFRAGAMGYVVKSGGSSELFEAIDAVSRGRSYLSPAVTQSMVDSITTDRQPRSDSGFTSLTGREREVLQRIAEGLGSREIADALHISPRTVESHRASLMKKLGVHKASSLVRIAIREDLVAP